ncbi:hypothetical protein SNE35_29770 [Paucibacter sp. R3-3]|uniref:Transposase n=1 Tax=Roseateles agri TaxID=3098619 RepID=A0ABU5DTF1_9BURK|nr:hypothetical protein [Paucibacter sp. R3-3]MDY0748724.1 hypothetical protein [Paucibacter sp. R3-3]
MPKSKNPAMRRIATTRARAAASGWGPDYLAPLRASRGEAPSISRASELYSPKVGRFLELLSTPEQVAGLLALHHPGLFELIEQKELSPMPDLNPLEGHPRYTGPALPPVSGTIDIADRMGLLRFHPKAWQDVPVLRTDDLATTAFDTADSYCVPGYWHGDLLLYLEDEQGMYCLHWDTKAKPGDHGMPGPGYAPSRRRQAISRAQARDKVVLAYFHEANIRTVRVAGSEIDRTVTNNLRAAVAWQRRPPDMTDELQFGLMSELRAALLSETTPIEVFRRFSRDTSASMDACRRVFYRAIMSRELRLDLFRDIVVDRPMLAERRDVLAVYADWFER